MSVNQEYHLSDGSRKQCCLSILDYADFDLSHSAVMFTWEYSLNDSSGPLEAGQGVILKKNHIQP